MKDLLKGCQAQLLTISYVKMDAENIMNMDEKQLDEAINYLWDELTPTERDIILILRGHTAK